MCNACAGWNIRDTLQILVPARGSVNQIPHAKYHTPRRGSCQPSLPGVVLSVEGAGAVSGIGCPFWENGPRSDCSGFASEIQFRRAADNASFLN